MTPYERCIADIGDYVTQIRTLRELLADARAERDAYMALLGDALDAAATETPITASTSMDLWAAPHSATGPRLHLTEKGGEGSTLTPPTSLCGRLVLLVSPRAMHSDDAPRGLICGDCYTTAWRDGWR